MSSTMRPKNNCKKNKRYIPMHILGLIKRKSKICVSNSCINYTLNWMHPKNNQHLRFYEQFTHTFLCSARVLWVKPSVCSVPYGIPKVFQKSWYQKIFQSCFISMSNIEMFNSLSLRLSSCICGVIWSANCLSDCNWLWSVICVL